MVWLTALNKHLTIHPGDITLLSREQCVSIIPTGNYVQNELKTEGHFHSYEVENYEKKFH